MIPEFQKFPKIPRFNRDIIITEKIDGTNAVVHIDEDGRVLAGSRKRWITPENDNFGFAAWVQEHEDELGELGPGYHYGEWWGRKIQRGYGLDHRRFSLFNVQRWRMTPSNAVYLIDADSVCVPDCCNTVPILYAGPWEYEATELYYEDETFTVESILYSLAHSGSEAAPGFMKPEGIVICHTAANQLFKMTIENDDEPKGTNHDAT